VACLGTRTRSLKVFGKLISMNIPETVKIGMVYGLVIFYSDYFDVFCVFVSKATHNIEAKRCNFNVSSFVR